MAATLAAILLLSSSCSNSAAPRAVDVPKAVKTRDALVAFFDKKVFRHFPVERAEFCQSGRQVFAVWYDPFSGRAACFLHAYYYDPEKHEWILFINRVLEGASDLSAEMTWDFLLFRDTTGAVVYKESISKLPSEEWPPETKRGR